MSEQIHIIIAGDEHTPVSFKFSRKKLIISASLVLCCAAALLSTGIFTASLYTHNAMLKKKTATAVKVAHDSRTAKAHLEDRLGQVMRDHERAMEDQKIEHRLLLSRLKMESSEKIAELEKKNLEQQMSFEKERDLLLSTAVSELNTRSEFIENVISDIGIKIKEAPKKSQPNSGGPFIAAESAVYDDLIFRTDYYLKTIQALPLGSPVKGSITSGFGKRKDPFNGKQAFHEGIDFRGKRGDPVLATADGTVVFVGKNGGYGKCIKIDHGNGYTTIFAHLDNYHVKKGDQVTRGQTVGLIGNTGRSTGPHLHYEIGYKGKAINPSKFLKVADRTCKLETLVEK